MSSYKATSAVNNAILATLSAKTASGIRPVQETLTKKITAGTAPSPLPELKQYLLI